MKSGQHPPRFDIEATARRLSPCQRDALLRGAISDEGPKTIRILLDDMLVYREPTVGTTCYSIQNTHFGEAVAEHLRAQSGAAS